MANHDERPFELERLIFFSDAVFAIAITLLALELKVPEGITGSNAAGELARRLIDMWPSYASYAISFLVIGLGWTVHHRTFRHILRYDQALIILNLVMMMIVAFMPFAAAVLGRYGYLQPSILLWSGGLAAIALLQLTIWRYATQGRRLVEPDLPERTVTYGTLRGLGTLAVALLSIAISFVNPIAADLVWLLLLVVYAVIGRLYPGAA